MDALELAGRAGFRKVFGTLARFPRRQFSIRELAAESGVPFTTTWKLLRLLDRAGVVEMGRVGRTAAVSFRESEFSKRLAVLLRLGVSPQALCLDFLKKQLAKNSAVREAFVFGSVARGSEGIESDVDVAVLSGKKFGASGLAARVFDEFGARIIFQEFSNKKDFDRFVAEKKGVRLV